MPFRAVSIQHRHRSHSLSSRRVTRLVSVSVVRSTLRNLYGLSGDGYFACRVCLRLGYASECEDRTGRLWRKMRKLEARLVDGELKPKWMQWRTFEQISNQMDAIDEAGR